MKIIHTGDWHMNDVLGRIDRTDEIFRSIAQIAALCETHNAEVLIVAGDLFSERSKPDATRAAIARLKEIFTPFLARGGTILTIPGNHDSETFFLTLRDAFDLVAPSAAGENGTHATGRLWIAPSARVVTLAGKGGERVQFALMPYPTPRGYLFDDDTEYKTLEDRNRKVQEAFTKTLKEDIIANKIDNNLPSVLVSHLHVSGANTHSLYKVTELEDVIFNPSDIPSHWAYAAYGHIHKPDTVQASSSHIRYCGSIVALDAAEAKDEKSVVLFEVGAAGLVGSPQLLPLKTTPLLDLDLQAEDVATLAEKYPDGANALVKYTLHWTPGEDNRDALCRAIHGVFPQHYARAFVERGNAQSGVAASNVDLNRVTENVREYISTSLKDKTERDEILALAEQLMMETAR